MLSAKHAEAALPETDTLCVVVQRINERADVEPSVTLLAQAVEVTLDGKLLVIAKDEGHMFAPTTWESFEVKRLTVEAET
jgi:hypothetical protein